MCHSSSFIFTRGGVLGESPQGECERNRFVRFGLNAVVLLNAICTVNPSIQVCSQRRINDEDLMTCEIANNSWGISPRNVRYISRNIRPIDEEADSSNELDFHSTVLHVAVNLWWVFNNLFVLFSLNVGRWIWNKLCSYEMFGWGRVQWYGVLWIQMEEVLHRQKRVTLWNCISCVINCRSWCFQCLCLTIAVSFLASTWQYARPKLLVTGQFSDHPLRVVPQPFPKCK